MTNKIRCKIERDLRRYPDWIVRLQARGLGLPSSPVGAGLGGSSSVETAFDVDEEIRSKVFVIESVFDRLSPTAKKLIEQRYFRGDQQKQVTDDLGISKRTYYHHRDIALESFARGFGYIK